MTNLPKLKADTFFSNSFYIFLVRLFPSLANTLVVIWYTRNLPQSVFGQYQNFWIQLNVIYPIACFGIHILIIALKPAVVARLAAKLSLQRYATAVVWLLLFGALFASLQCSLTDFPFFIPLLFLISYCISFVFESVLIVFRQYQVLLAVNISFSIVWCLLHWHVLSGGFSMSLLFGYLLSLTIVRTGIYLYAAIMQLRHQRYEPDEPQMAIRSMWFHFGLFDIVQQLSTWVDKFVISIILTTQLSAIYAIGSFNIPFLPLLLGAASSAVLMQLARSSAQNEKQDAIKLLLHSGRILSSIVFPVFCFLLVFRQEFITVLFSDQYLQAVPIFFVSLLLLPLRAYSFNTILQRMNKGAITNIGAVGELTLACALMYPLYRLIGLPGIALSFVISTYLQAAFYLYHTGRMLHTGMLQLIPLGNWTVKIIVFFTILITARYVLHSSFTADKLLILGGAVMGFVMAISLMIEYRTHSSKQHGADGQI